MEQQFDLDKAIRKVPDFPKPGILFYDITSILTNPEAFSYCIEAMKERYKQSKIDAIACVEARGFLFGAPIAREMGLPIVLVRKKGKLPGATLEKTFALEYGQDTIQIHSSDVQKGQKILVVDDIIATGGTLKAACELLSEAGAVVEDVFGIIGLPFLPYKQILSSYNVATLIEYESE